MCAELQITVLMFEVRDQDLTSTAIAQLPVSHIALDYSILQDKVTSHAFSTRIRCSDAEGNRA